MPLPDRPVDDAEIATDWGQEIHDRVFAPKGCVLAGGPVTLGDNTLDQIEIDTIGEDPGGWLVDPYAEVPVGAEGLYSLSAAFQTDDLDSGASIRCYVQVNGVEAARATEQGDDATQISIAIAGHLTLSAGDQITTFAKKIGTAGGPINVYLLGLSLIRLGNEYGA
jgi:hypothetical protein